MIELADRIAAFSALGRKMEAVSAAAWNDLAADARNENAWFDAANTRLAWQAVASLLNKGALEQWATPYRLAPERPKRVGIAMAGNIPLVGFHDFLSVLISGHCAVAKLSTHDSVLLKRLAAELVAIEPRFSQAITFADHLKGVDAVIATGSDNTSRYFEYYFRHVPHVIRKNRTSCAVLRGDEPAEELQRLGEDVFRYYGLGCRNVSKLYVPPGFDRTALLDSWAPYQPVIDHHKYANNYDYQKAIFLVNQVPHLDTGFVLLREETALVSPIAVVYLESYPQPHDLKNRLEAVREKIQCVVSAGGWWPGSVPFGRAQYPTLTDYADGVDTMRFLEAI